MILSDIKDYVREQKQVSLKDIAVRFDISESAAIEMIAHWERKGVIRSVHTEETTAPCSNACGQSCGGCPIQCTMIYQWVEKD